MKVYKIEPIGFASNTYILTADDKTAVIIDCAQPRVLDECARLGLKPEYVLLTHGHYDHIGGCGKAFLQGAQICCGEREKDLIFSSGNRAIFHNIEIPYFEIFSTLANGQELDVCGLKIKVIATPGHTAGSISFLVDGCLFTGDTLFFESVGRTDFETGNDADIVRSIKTLYAIDGDCKVFCGHGKDTTLNHERIFNPYVRN